MTVEKNSCRKGFLRIFEDQIKLNSKKLISKTSGFLLHESSKKFGFECASDVRLTDVGLLYDQISEKRQYSHVYRV